MDVDRAARRYALWWTVFYPIAWAMWLGWQVVEDLCSARDRGVCPPDAVAKVILWALVGLAMGLLWSGLRVWSYRRYRAAWVVYYMASHGHRIASREALRLQWPWVLLLCVCGFATWHSQISGPFWLRSLPSVAALASLCLLVPLTYWEEVALKREVLARRAEAASGAEPV
jgi:hypothetical protein